MRQESRVVDQFDVRQLRGDITRALTPLDQLYLLISSIDRMMACDVFIDRKKVFVSWDDAQVIVGNLLEYVIATMGEEKSEHTTLKLWNKIGPCIDAALPAGKIRLVDGYMEIQFPCNESAFINRGLLN